MEQIFEDMPNILNIGMGNGNGNFSIIFFEY